MSANGGTCGCGPTCTMQVAAPIISTASGTTPPYCVPDIPPATGGTGCGCGGGCGCGCGGGMGAGGPIPQVDAVLDAVNTPPGNSIPGANGSNYTLDPRTGSLTVAVRGPAAAKNAPIPVLTYSSRAAGSKIQYGYGWADVFNPTVSSMDGSANSVRLTKAACQSDLYTGKNGGGDYAAPTNATSALAQNGDNTWTETPRDGSKWRYDTSGLLRYMANPGGARWTMIRSGNLPIGIQSPFGMRTTYAYDGSNNIRRVLDPAGRITSYTVDGNGHLTQVTQPDGTTLGLRYDTNHLLTQLTDADGSRTSFVYDSLGRPTTVKLADGTRYTNVYTTGGIKVTDPAGNRTTAIWDTLRNVAAVVNPLGQRTSWLWSGRQLVAKIDARGNRTSLSYTTLSNRVSLLSSVKNPQGGRSTLLYDGNSRAKAVLDPLGNRETLIWDGSGQRVAVVNPQGGRTTTVYSAQGQPIAEINPLGARFTTIYAPRGRKRDIALEPKGGAQIRMAAGVGDGPIRLERMGRKIDG